MALVTVPSGASAPGQPGLRSLPAGSALAGRGYGSAMRTAVAFLILGGLVACLAFFGWVDHQMSRHR